jgi:hypothetical protein
MFVTEGKSGDLGGFVRVRRASGRMDFLKAQQNPTWTDDLPLDNANFIS